MPKTKGKPGPKPKGKKQIILHVSPILRTMLRQERVDSEDQTMSEIAEELLLVGLANRKKARDDRHRTKTNPEPSSARREMDQG